ncbi:receptor-like protein 14 isoform X6 [Diospyros lotus]|uniref:receptor-like protein 14 isoform X6 n=1 Tax=Diospyros lotus TaxID=55363 RepID=UPI00224F2C6E|nr:receptor-like protein 14 isoform X6 [Diospyros lotus]
MTSITSHSIWVWMMAMVVSVLVNEMCCHGCWEEEMIALLHLKASMNYPNGNSLPSWVDNKSSNCCQWERVECSDTSNRVIQLSLNGTREWISRKDWYFNASLLLPFKEIKTLELSDNALVGWTKNEGFEKLSTLTNLEVLDLSYNEINNFKILEFIGGISSLKSLNLGHNYRLESSYDLTSFEKLSMLTNLEVLDLSFNWINNSKILEFIGGISSLKSLNLQENELGSLVDLTSFKKFRTLTNLEVLDLGYNGINNSKILEFIDGISSLKSLNLEGNSLGSSVDLTNLENVSHLEELYLDRATLPNDFLSSIGAMTSLQVLSLAWSGLIGTLPSHQGLCELKTLQEIDLSFNGLRGQVPWCLRNLTSLKFLDISNNQFIGNIALSPLANIISLEYLMLSNNKFLVPISFKSYYNLSKLVILESVNNILLEENDILGSSPSFQLLQIRLSSSEHGRNISMSLPNFFYYQNQLKMVELFGFGFGGTFPLWLLENNTGLLTFTLSKNSFSEPFQLPSSPITELVALDISNNNFCGVIPYKIGSSFPKLKLLNMSRNNFEGIIPSSLGDMTSLYMLDLSNNHLSSKIPVHLAMGCSLLEVLKLSSNSLTGPILPPQNDLSNLKILQLDDNKFTEIPHNLSNSSGLSLLNLSHNHLEGEFPIEFCQFDQLSLLDLSDNNFTGTIPSCFNVEKLVQIQLSNNRLNGPFPEVFHQLTYWINMIDLSNNHFNGSIPNWINSLSWLSIFILKNNHFESNIPDQMCQLSGLTLIDLSFNKLSGSIPRCLNNLTFELENGMSYFSRLYCIEVPLKPNLKIYGHHGYSTCINNNDPLLTRRGLLLSQLMEFTTKGMTLSYTGEPMFLFSAIDLSNNKLVGHIPPEIGNLSKIKALNLSHNNLIGGIPTTFSKLQNIESLDLSHNNLNGNIPSQLTDLCSLVTFNVSYNNFSGRIPQAKNQFGTFDSSSYIENPFLCGEPLRNNCMDSPLSVPSANNNASAISNFIDVDTFYMSFAGSYIAILLAIVGIFYINPHWRRARFHVIEVFIISSYYFVVDNMWRIKVGFLRKY